GGPARGLQCGAHVADFAGAGGGLGRGQPIYCCCCGRADDAVAQVSLYSLAVARLGVAPAAAARRSDNDPARRQLAYGVLRRLKAPAVKSSDLQRRWLARLAARNAKAAGCAQPLSTKAYFAGHVHQDFIVYAGAPPVLPGTAAVNSEFLANDLHRILLLIGFNIGEGH